MKNENETCEFLRAVLDANPSIVLIYDDKLNIVASNKAANIFIGENPVKMQSQSSGAALGCFNTFNSAKGCNSSTACSKCIIHNLVMESLQGKDAHRTRAKMTLVKGDVKEEHFFLVTSSPLQFEGKPLVHIVLEDITEYMEMRDLLPICSSCKKIRNDDNYWNSVEQFIQKYFEGELTHGYCPDCTDE